MENSLLPSALPFFRWKELREAINYFEGQMEAVKQTYLNAEENKAIVIHKSVPNVLSPVHG